MSSTEIVYVVSPNYGCYLFGFLHSLLASKSSFDKVTIFCIGKRPSSWIFKDSRIVVEEVPSLDVHYFLINKTYITNIKADRVIFLDSDTLILNSLDHVWQGVNTDFIGRVTSYPEQRNCNQQKWIDLFQSINAQYTPYFNAGFFIIQNGKHHDLPWYSLVQSGLKKELFDPSKIHPSSKKQGGVPSEGMFMTEQIALSLAIGSSRLSYHILSRREHAYGWKSEPYDDAIVYHTGGHLFFRYAALLEKEKYLNFTSSKAVSQLNRTQLQLRWKLFKSNQNESKRKALIKSN